MSPIREGVKPPLVSTMVLALAYAWKHAPVQLFMRIVLTVIGALLPALQVVVVARLTDAVSAGHGGSPVLMLVMVAAAAVGLVTAIGDLEIASVKILMNRLQSSYQEDVARRMAGESPETLADAILAEQARESLETIREYARGYASTSLTVLEAGITIPSLVWALWGHSWIAALLIVASLVPTVFAFSFVSKITESGWRGLSEQERRIRYSLDQLTY